MPIRASKELLSVDGETEFAVRYNPPGQREKWVGGARYTQEELNDGVLRAHKARSWRQRHDSGGL